jgi:hypothetical protein
MSYSITLADVSALHKSVTGAVGSWQSSIKSMQTGIDTITGMSTFTGSGASSIKARLEEADTRVLDSMNAICEELSAQVILYANAWERVDAGYGAVIAEGAMSDLESEITAEKNKMDDFADRVAEQLKKASSLTGDIGKPSSAQIDDAYAQIRAKASTTREKGGTVEAAQSGKLAACDSLISALEAFVKQCQSVDVSAYKAGSLNDAWSSTSSALNAAQAELKKLDSSVVKAKKAVSGYEKQMADAAGSGGVAAYSEKDAELQRLMQSEMQGDVLRGFGNGMRGFGEFGVDAAESLVDGVTIGVSKLFGQEPPAWTKDTSEFWSGLAQQITSDPGKFFGDMWQGFVDEWNKKGAAYTAGDIASIFVGSGVASGAAKVGKATEKAAKAAKTAEKAAEAAKVAKAAEKAVETAKAAEKAEKAAKAAKAAEKAEQAEKTAKAAEAAEAAKGAEKAEQAAKTAGRAEDGVVKGFSEAAKGAGRASEAAGTALTSSRVITDGGKTAGKTASTGEQVFKDSDHVRVKEASAPTPVERGKQWDADGDLKPNITYKTGEYDYTYVTDSQGRIIEAKTEKLRFTERAKRLRNKSNTSGKLEDDHAGHLIGDQFGGSNELDNLVSQARSVNLGEYKKLENLWAKSIKEGKEVRIDIKVNFKGTSARPDSFKINYQIDGDKFSKIILNVAK